MTFCTSCVEAQAQAHVARINLAITSQKMKTTSARSRKRRGQYFKRNKVAPGEDKYDCALIKSVEGSVFSRPREDLTRVRERFAWNLGSS